MFNFLGRIRFAKRSSQWPKIRKEHLDKFNFCAGCGKTTDLEVHHIEPVHINPEKELDPDNLITLCNKHCHLHIGHLMDFKSWNIDVIKDAGVYLKKVKNRPYKK